MSIETQADACIAFNDFFTNMVDKPDEPVFRAISAGYKAYRRATKGEASPTSFVDWLHQRVEQYDRKVEPLVNCRRFNVPDLAAYPATMHGWNFAKATNYVLDLLSNADDKRHLHNCLSQFTPEQLKIKAVA